jgi:hypothetical protein
MVIWLGFWLPQILDINKLITLCFRTFRKSCKHFGYFKNGEKYNSQGKPNTAKLKMLQARFDWTCSWTVLSSAKWYHSWLLSGKVLYLGYSWTFLDRIYIAEIFIGHLWKTLIMYSIKTFMLDISCDIYSWMDFDLVLIN